MPSLPRGEVIDESVVGTYHIWGRVTQRDFLLGRDPKTGRNHRHRKKKIRLRIEALLSIFGIECLDRAILDNHYVNMNLIHAGMAEGLDDSDETSMHDRLEDRRSGDPKRPCSGSLAAVHTDGDGYVGTGVPLP